MKRRVLVTGGAGFIGSHVVERFLRDGDQVEVLDNLSTGVRDHVPAGVTLHAMDIASADASRVVREGGFGVIAHCAAQIDVRQSVEAPVANAMTNIGGSLTLLEAVRKLPQGKRPRVVFASSCAVYGDDIPVPTPESCPASPIAPYALAKLATEHYLAYYGRVWGMGYAVLRVGNVYGPRQRTDGDAGVVTIFINRLLAALPLVVYGDGQQTRDCIFVDDVADAFVAATEHPLAPAGNIEARAFNVGTGIATSVTGLAQIIGSVLGIEPEIAFAPGRVGEIRRSLLDPQKAYRQLGWRAKIDRAEGVSRTVKWFAAASAKVAEPLRRDRGALHASQVAI